MTYTRQLKYLDLVLKNNCVPHAFIFYGTDFVYKKELAQSFFVKLNGAELKDKIESKTHPDTLFLERREGKKEIVLAQIKELREFVSRTPFHLRRKGVFVVEAEYLNEEAWNALLKTLEEPAGSAIIFIIAASLENIPQTILSRAVSLPFYAGSDLAKSLSPKDDIILNKLANLGDMPWAERIDLAEEIAKKENITPLLDSWLLQLRNEMLNGSNKNKIGFIMELADVRNLLNSTNVNARLALENIFLKI